MNIQELFKISMDRELPTIRWPHRRLGSRVNLGIGKKEMPEGVVSVGLPDWDADTMPIPYGDQSCGEVWALHFLEHVADPVAVLRECQRVLVPGGVLNICVPYGACHMWVHDLTHKHMFNEDTWRQTFNNVYYDDKGTDWKFRVGFNTIMGVKGENLALITQLERTS